MLHCNLFSSLLIRSSQQRAEPLNKKMKPIRSILNGKKYTIIHGKGFRLIL